jgi:hypothetical protein
MGDDKLMAGIQDFRQSRHCGTYVVALNLGVQRLTAFQKGIAAQGRYNQHLNLPKWRPEPP